MPFGSRDLGIGFGYRRCRLCPSSCCVCSGCGRGIHPSTRIFETQSFRTNPGSKIEICSKRQQAVSKGARHSCNQGLPELDECPFISLDDLEILARKIETPRLPHQSSSTENRTRPEVLQSCHLIRRTLKASCMVKGMHLT